MGVPWSIYGIVCYLYVFSVLLSIADFVYRNWRFRAVAFTLLVGCWTLLVIFFLIRFAERDFVPFFTVFDTIVFFAWVLITLSLIIKRAFRTELPVFFANVFGFALIVFSLFADKEVPHTFSARLMSEFLIIHVLLALLANALFLMSMCLSVLYLILNAMLKRKRWNRLVRLAPGLIQVERIVYGVNATGAISLLLSLIFGLIWAQKLAVANVWTDVKVWTSFFVFGVYVYYIYRRLASNWSGKSLAIFNAVAFMTVIFNLFLSNACLSFHCW